MSNNNAALDELERKKMEAQFKTGGGKDQQATFIVNEKGVTKVLEKDSMKQEETLFIKNCEDGNYTIASRCTKILIEGCKNCKIALVGRILTNVVEVWRCENFGLNVQTDVKTLQIDLYQIRPRIPKQGPHALNRMARR